MHQFTQPLLVHRVAERPDQRDRHSINVLQQRAQDLARLIVVEGCEHAAIREDALRDLDDVPMRHQRGGLVGLAHIQQQLRCEASGTTATAHDLQRITVTLRCDQTHPSALALHHQICADRRAVAEFSGL